MKMTIFVLLTLILTVPCIIQAETIYLLDGSSLVGTVEKIVGDTLYVKPSFGGTIRLTKQLIWKIQFSDTAPAGHVESKPGPTTSPMFSSPEPGSLMVTFDGLKVSNKIAVHRGRDYQDHERANAIEAILIVDGQTVGSYIDSTTDKTIRKGPDTYLKNTVQLKDFKVQLATGPHTAQLLIRNPHYPRYKNAFEQEPLNLKLDLGNLIIYPAQKSIVPVGLKKGFLKLGRQSLIVK